MYQNTENGMMFFGNFDENKIRQYNDTHQQYRPTYNAVVVLDFCKTFCNQNYGNRKMVKRL
jgi:hypothetical protein